MAGRLIQMILMAAVSAAVFADAEEYKRERYDVIVDRSPFGEDSGIAADLAREEAQSKKDAAEAAKLAREMEKKIRLCYLLEADNGELRAGFENKGAKPGDPRSIMLRLNESFQGMKLTAIDVLRSSATLEMNGKPVTFELTQAAAATPAKKAGPVAQRRKFGSGFRRPEQPTKPAEPELTPEEQAAKREEVRENLRQYQMEVIRQGMPPLPIPLTQEMDDQLVEEGILPPSGPAAPGP
ncbi:hypothetical protein [Pontiella agarivorans]|uniref:Uncharacterized protein n=1 Tax=Pontiella agarivorans TaxID=3038953 RepID=A0ABU5MZJ1_9BACT|nr:hypothetical protein [Pontiella agarivorans]MDZ8119602.1 hypothetical protein [Pontiella agarivorans]